MKISVEENVYLLGRARIHRLITDRQAMALDVDTYIDRVDDYRVSPDLLVDHINLNASGANQVMIQINLLYRLTTNLA